jgi:hypothetical protein
VNAPANVSLRNPSTRTGKTPSGGLSAEGQGPTPLDGSPGSLRHPGRASGASGRFFVCRLSGALRRDFSAKHSPGLSRRRGSLARRLSTFGSITRRCEDRLEAPGFKDQLARGFDRQVIGLHQGQQHSSRALGMSRHYADAHDELFRRFADARSAIPDVNRSCRLGNSPTQLPGSGLLGQFLANRCRRPGEPFCTFPQDPLPERHSDWTLHDMDHQPTDLQADVSRRNPFGAGRAGVRRKNTPQAQISAWGDEVGPHAAADKTPEVCFSGPRRGIS